MGILRRQSPGHLLILWLFLSVACAEEPLFLSQEAIHRLRAEFGRAQAAELLSVRDRHQSELQEFNAAQAAAKRDWEMRETRAKETFFRQTSDVVERRNYQRDIEKRRIIFMRIMEEERRQRGLAHLVRVRAVEADQQNKKREFEAYLARRERPPQNLWPQSW